MLAVREEGENACGLSQGLDHQHPWHHRVAGEVPLKEGLVDGDVLQRPNGSAGVQPRAPDPRGETGSDEEGAQEWFLWKGDIPPQDSFSRGGAGETDAANCRLALGLLVENFRDLTRNVVLGIHVNHRVPR